MSEQARAKKSSWRINARRMIKAAPFAFSFMFQAAPLLVVIAMLVQIVTGLLPIAHILIGKQIVDLLVASIAVHAVIPEIFNWLALLLVTLAVSRILIAFHELLDLQLKSRCNLYVQEQLIMKTSALDLMQVESNEVQTHVEKIRGDAWKVPQFPYHVANVLSDGVSVIGVIAILWHFSPWLILAIAFIRGVHAFANAMLANRVWNTVEWRTEKVRSANTAFRLLIEKQDAKEVRLFQLAPNVITQHRRLLEEVRKEDAAPAFQNAAVIAFLDLCSVALYGVLYARIISAVAIGVLTIGDLTLYTSGFMQVEGGMRGVVWGMRQILDGLIHFSHIQELMEMKPTIVKNSKGRKLASGPLEVRFENVGFKYPSAKKWSLQNVSVTLKKGEIVGLVGENGAGKTTFLKLLARLYEPTEGRIFVNGIDVREYRLDDLHRAIGIIFQDFTRFQMTARENISFGDVEAASTVAAVEPAAKLSGVHEVLRDLPSGYESVLSLGWLKGTEISGSEWQKVALARALFRRKASLVVLDEPTSAFDAKAEFEFFQDFLKTAEREKKGAIIVSHRFSNIRIAKHIIVLDNGTVAEEGTHEELMQNKGLYEQLYTLQRSALE